MEILTRTEGELLNFARRMLLDIAKRIESETSNEPWQQRNIGRIHYSFEKAEDGIFEALNMLSSFGGDKLADEFTTYVGRSRSEEQERETV